MNTRSNISREYVCNSNYAIDTQEELANASISRLISSITVLTKRKDPLILGIKSPKLLIRGLTELQGMVEMVDIKCSIVDQIKFLITNQARKQQHTGASQSHFEGHMLHSVISGNPGTGKTTVGLILAKIWMSLGFVNKKDTHRASSEKYPKDAPVILTNDLFNDIHNRRVAQLEEDQRNNHRQLNRLRQMLTRFQTTSAELRRLAIKLQPTHNKPYTRRRNTDKEWEVLLSLARDLRFGADSIVAEANFSSSIGDGAMSQSTFDNSDEDSTPPDMFDTPEDPLPDPFDDADPKFVVASREDLIAEFLGQTAPKTKSVLDRARGGVLFIDEAYSLCNMDSGSKDKYGEECLNTINEFMSLHPDEIIIIFAGYKDKLMNSIFKAQPGLMRRCAYFFEIKDYTINGLDKIFKRQLHKNGWGLDPNSNLPHILNKNLDLIDGGGGGFTEKLAFFSKLVYGSEKFDKTVENVPSSTSIHDSIITDDMILSALSMLRNSSVSSPDVPSPPLNMYI